ncbi:hypothetical protein GGR91_002112 [Sphingorhabdus rigui]|uniref:Uncharacterized protein n=1 Tax=Sphingorhabdus rigui TaxID=1282858 RepID=A0A840B0G3_9SPHN|nr:hypothetical protein [Sphingorhabdus rigui]
MRLTTGVQIPDWTLFEYRRKPGIERCSIFKDSCVQRNRCGVSGAAHQCAARKTVYQSGKPVIIGMVVS